MLGEAGPHPERPSPKKNKALVSTVTSIHTWWEQPHQDKAKCKEDFSLEDRGLGPEGSDSMEKLSWKGHQIPFALLRRRSIV